VTYLNAAKKF